MKILMSILAFSLALSASAELVKTATVVGAKHLILL